VERSSQPLLLGLAIYFGLALGCAKGAEIAPGEIVILTEQPADAGRADAGRADAATAAGSAPQSSPASEGSAPASGSAGDSRASPPGMPAAAVLMPEAPDAGR
jgi:hypothetical protein